MGAYTQRGLYSGPVQYSSNSSTTVLRLGFFHLQQHRISLKHVNDNAKFRPETYGLSEYESPVTVSSVTRCFAGREGINLCLFFSWCRIKTTCPQRSTSIRAPSRTMSPHINFSHRVKLSQSSCLDVRIPANYREANDHSIYCVVPRNTPGPVWVFLPSSAALDWLD